MTSPEPTPFQFPAALEKYFKPDAPKDVRLMAAKGLVPMGPGVLASAMGYFLSDPEADIQKIATEGLKSMPIAIVQKVVAEEIHPAALDFFAREHISKDQVLEPIMLNPNAADSTFITVATQCSERTSVLITNNQVRLMRTPQIAEGLRKNPNVLKSEVDRVVSFLRMNGIVLEGESPELTQAEIKEILNAAEPVNATPIPVELIQDDKDAKPLPEEKKKSLYQIIQRLNVGGKIKLALKGNKEARSLLIKDSNKVVVTSVLKSPRITDGEILTISNMRTIYDECIRMIPNNPEWMRNYNIQVALANNPKTPFPIGLKIVRQLRVPDLEKVSKNKNIAGQLSKLARELFEQKRK